MILYCACCYGNFILTSTKTQMRMKMSAAAKFNIIKNIEPNIDLVMTDDEKDEHPPISNIVTCEARFSFCNSCRQTISDPEIDI